MDNFLDNIEKYKFAIFGTIFLHIMVFFFSIFTTIQDVVRIPPVDVTLEIPLDDIEFEPEMEKILDLNKVPLPSENVNNLATDANDSREKSYEDYSTNMEDLSEESMLSAKELEAKYFEDAAANNDRTNVASDMEEHKINEAKSNNDNVTSGGANAFAGEVMISYSLNGRKSYSLPNPGYTCNGSGVVVIQIKADKSGNVKDATYMAKSSNGASSCMIERALKYAKKSRFDYKASTAMQTGTITYKFIGK
jgi:hypothetical protein